MSARVTTCDPYFSQFLFLDRERHSIAYVKEDKIGIVFHDPRCSNVTCVKQRSSSRTDVRGIVTCVRTDHDKIHTALDQLMNTSQNELDGFGPLALVQSIDVVKNIQGYNVNTAAMTGCQLTDELIHLVVVLHENKGSFKSVSILYLPQQLTRTTGLQRDHKHAAPSV